ncbi:MAG TPA: acyltransferase family protein [Candidatus Eisenbergiella merdipullorum]|uniref:Acyltransferase family protein n=1 Tax=Candidatus Eisenbergiella merdipullorum TaxID=2838553 RepID=A0A9D2I7H3_9FIRM|nr:acyltransferase family protein [Candidatus Eisenbergiella merdipullorum]
MVQKRIEYLDVVKVIAIFLVVFCHFVLLAQTIPANLFMSACWSGVPLFFLVNGALLFTRPLSLKKHIRKTLTIYLVLVIWRLIYLLSIGAINHVPSAGFGKSQILVYLFAFGSLEGIGTGHLWFIEALLAVYLLFPLFRVCFDLPYGRKLILFFAIYGLLMTNGMTGAQMLLDGLTAAGWIGNVSLSSLDVLNPFGIYANMLGFFLLGAWLHTGPVIGKSIPAQRLTGVLLAAVGLPGIWAVKWYMSGTPAWDGILLAEGYRHLPVILLAVGIFLICRDLTIKNKVLSTAVRAVASRTLGIYYLHWILGWLLVPYMALLLPRFSVAANTVKTIALILPALLVTFLLEKIPLVRKLVTG